MLSAHDLSDIIVDSTGAEGKEGLERWGEGEEVGKENACERDFSKSSRNPLLAT